MNNTEVTNFFAKQIKNQNQAPQLVTKTKEFKSAAEYIQKSTNWQVISNIVTTNIDFDKEYESCLFRNTVIAVTHVDGTYYIFKVYDVHGNDFDGGKIIHHCLYSDLIRVNTYIDMFNIVCEFVLDEYGNDYIKKLVHK